ncbi:MFS transporter [Chitinophaga solisilvae]|uniref:MFS transporter n=1 Tax=Chitinophaga solisilvae TaxID=1233460 RepID=A0A3S1CZZ2_9BACT|nr:MFS transporter [Chitinophaga solisilvae]NSL86762.1 MFS transporter [Chitinophaga solisilvae]
MEKNTAKIPFSTYQKLVVFILAITQFTVVLDFMVMSPLGDLLMKSMDLTPTQFGWAVSAYAFSAGASGLLTAGFADRFDRKKLLLFFYGGFILGTIFCGMASTYPLLIAARIITGLFGGVIGSISMAIVTDLFDIHHRGRVMGFLMMGFGASQVLGIPVSLKIADHLGWQSPFLMVAGLAFIIFLVILFLLKPLTQHLALQQPVSAFSHLMKTFAKKDYRMGFLATILLSVGGFMMMPFGSAFAVNNLKVDESKLWELFMVAGISSLIFMPLVGKLSDRIDKFKLFTAGVIWMLIAALIYTNLGPTPLPIVMVFNILMMIGILGRMIPANALTSGVPAMADRGAFMSINSSLQQIAGGVAAAVAGKIVMQKDKLSPLEHYDIVGYVVAVLSLISIVMIYRVSVMIKQRSGESKI